MTATTTDTPSADAATQRLFVALPVPDIAARILTALPRRGLDAHWVPAKALHITLRFLGDVPAGQVPDVIAALSRLRRPRFTVEIDGLGHFGDMTPAILFARIASTRKVTALCAEITDTLTPFGFDFGMRPFVPHVTIARVEKGDAASYAARHGKTCRTSWSVTSYTLSRSSSGQAASSLRVYPLG